MAAAAVAPLSNLSGNPPQPFVHNEQNTTENKTFKLPISTDSLRIVSAAYKEGPTGLTLFMFPNRKSYGAVDIRGGSPGHLFPRDGLVDGVVLSGGSLLGLECGTGVSAEIWKHRQFDSGWDGIPLVKGAIIFDYTARPNSFYPDHALGRAAAAAALSIPKSPSSTFFLGQAGAGYSASCGKALVDAQFKPSYCELAGQGAGFRLLGKKSNAKIASGPEDDVWIAAFTVVNAVGHIVDRTGRTVRGHVDPADPSKHLSTDQLLEKLGNGNTLEQLLTPTQIPGSDQKSEVAPNTTISLVVTNLALPPEVITQVGRQIHASMGRGIHPFAALFDGDQLWTVSTMEVQPEEAKGTNWGSTYLGMMGSEAMWDAILNCY